ncbi:MAG: methionine biosynthesis protein MetW, partial [Psychrobacter sp.]|nr:methionine biosynthesis protein MetW [Psychrobacter sp.]
MRMDHQLAERWIAPQSHVLDLGCGNGELLAHLQQHRGVTGYG